MTEFAMLYENGEEIHELKGFPLLAWSWLTSSFRVGYAARLLTHRSEQGFSALLRRTHWGGSSL